MEFLLELKDILLIYSVDFLKSGWWIYIPAQALVYIFGRMLGVLNANWSRNLLALVAIIIFSYGYVTMTIGYDNLQELIWLTMQWASRAILYYVLVGFSLVKRVDHFLDKKFADDEQKKKKKR